MILSDLTIMRRLTDQSLVIDPNPLSRELVPKKLVQPCSVDLRLGNSFGLMAPHSVECIDPYATKGEDITEERTVPDGECFVMHPGMFVLATTVERVGLPPDLSGQVNGKSSLGRIGLLIHSTAGFIDPGFEGTIVLELANVGVLPIKLWPGMKIAQISFTQLDRPALLPYGSPGLNSKYQGQTGVVASRYALNRSAS